jgi:hypothetical protein
MGEVGRCNYCRKVPCVCEEHVRISDQPDGEQLRDLSARVRNLSRELKETISEAADHVAEKDSRIVALEAALKAVLEILEDTELNPNNYDSTELAMLNNAACEAYLVTKMALDGGAEALAAHDRALLVKAAEKLTSIAREPQDVKYTKDFNAGWDAAVDWLREMDPKELR